MKYHNFLWKSKIILLTVGIMTISLPIMAEEGKGMTWGYRGEHIFPNNKHNVYVGCNSTTVWAPGQTKCDAYKGETSCTKKRHILCMKEVGNIKRPPYVVGGQAHSMPKEFYWGWSPRKIKLGPKKKGIHLTSLAVANNFCGNGWRMAEFHDGYWIAGMGSDHHHKNSSPQWNLANAKSGGWAYYARFQGNNNRLNKLKNKRFWVHSNTTKANCWD